MMIEEVALSDLIPYENNPRKNAESVEAVAKSIEEFGFRVPIVIDKENVIIAGHSRYLAAESLGLKKVPVVRADDLTPDQVKAFRLVDNKTAEFAGWDFSKLEEELANIKMDLRGFGFNAVNDFESIDFDSFDGMGGSETHKEYKCPCCGQWFEVKA